MMFSQHTHCGMPDRPTTTAVLHFMADWQETQSDGIRPGSTLVIHYDPQRLPSCRAKYLGLDAWGITAHVRFFPGGECYSGSIVTFDTASQANQSVPFQVAVPDEAVKVAIWFHNSDRSGCNAWDSRFGQNYWFYIFPENIA